MQLKNSITGSITSQTHNVSIPFPPPSTAMLTEVWNGATVHPAQTQFWFDDQGLKQSWRSKPVDNESFKDVVKSGKIKMTNYERGSIESTAYCFDLPRESNFYQRRATATFKSGVIFARDDYLFQLKSRYTITTCESDLKSRNPALKTYSNKVDETEIADAIADVQGGVVGDLNSTYDVLTDLSELRATLEMLKDALGAVHHPLRTFKMLRNKILDGTQGKAAKAGRAQKEILDLWMQYRYGLMPLLYSIQDAMKAVKESNRLYLEARGTRQLIPEPVDYPPKESCFIEKNDGTVRITAVGRQSYLSRGQLRFIDQLGINIFRTGWELIPFSFVVDWVVNVGDYLDAQLGDMVSLYDQRECCYAVKTEMKTSLYYHDYNDGGYNHLNGTKVAGTGPFTLNGVLMFPRTEIAVGLLSDGLYLARETNLTTYSRHIFHPKDVKLRVNPFLNWKRWLDAYALGLGKTRRALRSLK